MDVIQGRSDEQLRTLADTVQQVMLAVFAAPAKDQSQSWSSRSWPPNRATGPFVDGWMTGRRGWAGELGIMTQFGPA